MRPVGIALRIGFLCLVAGLLVVGAVFAWARSWTADRLAELSAGGEDVQTGAGIQQIARRGSGARVLMIHGEAGGYDQALQLADLLGLDEAEIIAPSRPGYLGTPVETGTTIEEQAKALEILLKELEVGSLPVVAFGTGVPVALWLAAIEPELVDRLVLISGFYSAPPDFPLVLTELVAQPIRQGIAGRLLENDPQAFISPVVEMTQTMAAGQVQTTINAIEADPSRLEAMAGFLGTTLPLSPRSQGLRNDFQQLAGTSPLPVNLPACPVLILHGAADRMAPVGAAHEQSAKLPKANVLTPPDVGHWPWIDAGWSASQKAVADFLGFTGGHVPGEASSNSAKPAP
ncbi:MAG: hypothetical protein Fur0032_20270 [Terrimicrobiaceae bacterium]